MKNIIVVGYPKSGCTWATRLVAELVGCPVAGFLHSEKREIAVEGLERESEYRCYKSHHQLAELEISPNDPYARIVYVLRDPRDITLSAANHFIFRRRRRNARMRELPPRWQKVYLHTLYPLFVRRNFRLEKMTGALLHGDSEVHNWCRVSWLAHLQPYRDAGVLMVRYEDLLAQPEKEATRVLQHLHLSRSPEAIAAAIKAQSFAQKKEKFLREGERGRAKFLRIGKSGQWRTHLPAHLQRRFRDELGDALRAYGYSA